MSKKSLSILIIVPLVLSVFFANFETEAKTLEPTNSETMDSLDQRFPDIINTLPISTVLAKDFIRILTSSLSEKGTNAEQELRSFCNDIRNLLYSDDHKKSSSNYESVSQLLVEANTVYDKYISFAFSHPNTNRDDDTAPFEGAVGVVIAWFYNNGYLLSAELLTHAMNNSTLNSNYYPVYGNLVEYSDVFWACHNNISVMYGTDSFELDGSSSAAEKDLYYAIHSFTWYRLTNGNIRITDRYDFHYDKDYWGTIQGYAVYTMLVAQNMGVLTPYYVYIIHA